MPISKLVLQPIKFYSLLAQGIEEKTINIMKVLSLYRKKCIIVPFFLLVIQSCGATVDNKEVVKNQKKMDQKLNAIEKGQKKIIEKLDTLLEQRKELLDVVLGGRQNRRKSLRSLGDAKWYTEVGNDVSLENLDHESDPPTDNGGDTPGQPRPNKQKENKGALKAISPQLTKFFKRVKQSPREGSDAVEALKFAKKFISGIRNFPLEHVRVKLVFNELDHNDAQIKQISNMLLLATPYGINKLIEEIEKVDPSILKVSEKSIAGVQKAVEEASSKSTLITFKNIKM